MPISLWSGWGVKPWRVKGLVGAGFRSSLLWIVRRLERDGQKSLRCEPCLQCWISFVLYLFPRGDSGAHGWRTEMSRSTLSRIRLAALVVLSAAAVAGIAAATETIA